MKAEKPAGPDDDDLTSLTWLQDKNLLKGMNLRTASNAGAQGSPTSDYVDEGSCCSTGEPPASDSSGCSSSGRSPASPGSAVAVAATSTPVGTASGATPVTGAAAVAVMAARGKHPQHVPYDPLVHVNSKPPYSFSCLIFMAIEDSPGHALPVKEIYSWILDHFPYFKNAPTGWKNSVRHNLSLNKCFRKVEKAPNLGKGSLWMVDPMYRPNLVQALAKSPFHPYSTIVSRTASVNSSPGSGSLPSTPAKVPLSPGRAARQQSPPASAASGSGNGSSGSSSSNSSSVSTGSNNSNNTSTNSNSSTTSNTSTSVSPGSAATPTAAPNNNNNVPDPTLFPFLSRRLALSTTPQSGSPPPSQPSSQLSRDDSPEDVEDAAAAMLILKHAHLRMPRKDDWFKRLREETSEALGLRKKMRVSSRSGQTEERMVITTSPSEDHTYSAALNLSARSSGTVAVSTTPAGPHGPHAPPSTTSSPDEAFEEGSDSDDGTDGKTTRLGRGATIDTVPCVMSAHRILYNHHDRGDTSDEERRKIAEGADALLNLAGIRTDGGPLSPPPSLVTPSPAPPPHDPPPAPKASQPSPSSVYSGPRSRRRKKPPPPSSRAVVTHKYQHHRSSSGHGSGSHAEKRGSGSSTSSRR